MVLPIPSYNHGEFDPYAPSDEPDTTEPPPTEEDLELASRAPGSELAVIDAARQRDNPAARSQRAAARADAASARGGGESTSSATTAAAPATAAAAAPAEPLTDTMLATATDNGEASGESAVLRDEDVSESDLFGEDDEEGGGTLSSPLTHAPTPAIDSNHQRPPQPSIRPMTLPPNPSRRQRRAGHGRRRRWGRAG